MRAQTTTRTRRRKSEEDLSPQSLSRKQVLDMLRKGRALVDSDLRGTDLSGICFDGVNLQWAKLADADLSRCSFRGANLSGASMWHANLKDCVFDESILGFADLDEANIEGCTFEGARIKKTTFPNPRVSLTLVEESVRTGTRVHVQRDSEPLDE